MHAGLFLQPDHLGPHANCVLFHIGRLFGGASNSEISLVGDEHRRRSPGAGLVDAPGNVSVCPGICPLLSLCVSTGKRRMAPPAPRSPGVCRGDGRDGCSTHRRLWPIRPDRLEHAHGQHRKGQPGDGIGDRRLAQHHISPGPGIARAHRRRLGAVAGPGFPGRGICKRRRCEPI